MSSTDSAAVGGIDLEVDPVRAGAAREAGKAATDEIDEGDEVRRVADVCGEEPMERVWNASGHERYDPRCKDGEDDRDRPEHDPDEVRDGEEEAEEDREARPLEVVRDDDADRVFGELARTARRVRDPTSGSGA